MAIGDRLAVERRLAGSVVSYTHLGIDMGDGSVVHARPDDPENIFGGGRVARTTLAEFAGGEAVRVVVDPAARFSPAEVAQRALALLDRDGYCPVGENCEHFATWCATGSRDSRQVDLVVGRLGVAAMRLATLAAARSGGRAVLRAGVGAPVRLGLGALLPATLAAEGAALAVEWTTCQAGYPAKRCRLAGERAGMTTSALVCAVAAAGAGPACVVGGAVAGAALWLAGSAVAAVADRRLRSSLH